MKKAIITAIILINCITLYFWMFPYQNKQDLYVLKLVDRTLRIQSEVIGTNSEYVLKTISRAIEAYPQFEDYENQAKEIHELTRANYLIIEGLRDSMMNEFPENYLIKLYDNPEEAFAFKYRLRPFFYQIPKKVMSNHWAKARMEMIENQTKILDLIEVDSFRQVAKDSILTNVDELPQLLKKANIIEAFSLLSTTQMKIRNTEYQLLTYLSIELAKQRNEAGHKVFVPIVYANTSNLEIGDTYEAEIINAAYLDAEYIKASVNGKAIPVENGIIAYKVKPTSFGKKKVTIKIEIRNIITKKITFWDRDFEYNVVNCN